MVLYLGLLLAGVRFLRDEEAGSPAGSPDPNLAAVVFQGAVGLVVAAVSLLALRRLRKGTARPGASPWRAAKAGVLYALAFQPVLLAVGFLQSFLREAPRPQALVSLATEGSVSAFLVVAAFAVLAAPFTEEVFFRGLLYGGLRTWTGRGLATLLTAVAFAAVHMEPGNPDALAPIFLLALFLCDLRERTEGVIAPIVMHACFNGLQMGMIYIMRSGGPGFPAGG